MKQLSLLIVLLLTGVARGEEASAQFERLFGAEVRRVTATGDAKDDLELAATLLDASGQAEDDLKVLLCEQSATLAQRSSVGGETAIRALLAVADAAPTRRAEMMQKVVDVRQRQYTTAKADERAAVGENLIAAEMSLATELENQGDCEAAAVLLRKAAAVAAVLKSPSRDRIKYQIDHTINTQRVNRQIEALKAKLKANTQDHAAADELLRVYVIDRDDPEGARQYTFLSTDTALQSKIKLATSDVEQITDQECFEVAEWYRDLAEQTKNPVPHLAMLRRAGDYYGQFLQKHDGEDIFKSKATLARTKVLDELKALEKIAGAEPARDPHAWIDVMPQIDLARDTAGHWSRKQNALVNPGTDHRSPITLPVSTRGSYELQIRYARITGPGLENTGGIAVGLPVASNSVALFVGISGDRENTTYTGLSHIDGHRVSDHSNPTRTKGVGAAAGSYLLEIKVLGRIDAAHADRSAIIAGLNGAKFLDWADANAKLSPSEILLEAHEGAITLWALQSGLIIQSIRFRVTDGEPYQLNAPAKADGAKDGKDAKDPKDPKNPKDAKADADKPDPAADDNQRRLDGIRDRLERELRKAEHATDTEKLQILGKVQKHWASLSEDDRRHIVTDLLKTNPDMRKLFEMMNQ